MNDAQKELDELQNRSVELPELGYYDYDWDRFVGFYDPETRMFYWMEGSGCSCNYLEEDYLSIGDLSVGRKDDILRAAADFCGSRYSDQFDSFQQAVRQLKI